MGIINKYTGGPFNVGTVANVKITMTFLQDVHSSSSYNHSVRQHLTPHTFKGNIKYSVIPTVDRNS